MKKKQNSERDPEIAAISAVYDALQGLSSEAQGRVLSYVSGKLKLILPPRDDREEAHHAMQGETIDRTSQETEFQNSHSSDDELQGISPIAQRWISRNGLKARALSAIFSLGVDEIDLIAKDVPGKSKKDRMHSVLLLKGIAAYLGSGVARFTNEQLKEACLHYKAYDSANFATHLKSFSSDVSGDKNSGYSLTPRGLAGATDLVKDVSQPEVVR